MKDEKKLNKITNIFLKKIDSEDFDLDEYIESLDNKKLEKILRDLSNIYYNEGESLVSDEIFDLMKDELEKKDPENEFLNEIGAPIDSKEKVKLPYPMGSLNKIKPQTDDLEKWKKDYNGPYIISDKLDGISAQLYITKNNDIKLYTRGDGEYGQDISYLVKYLIDSSKIEKQKNNLSIRGELIISKNNFNLVKDKFKNARNAVAGYVNAKKVDKTLSEIVEFIAYSVIEPELTQEDQMKFLKLFKPIKKVVEYKIYDKNSLTNENLSKYLQERRNNSDYDVDGIVVYDSNRSYEYSSGNPDHGFAFKSILTDQYAEALVKDIIWEPSMDGYLKPKVKINPIDLVGVTITYATAFHAKFVEDNKLGPGAIIKIIRSGDVIPHILEVIKPSTNGKPKMPNAEYIWDKNHVNILVKNINNSVYTDLIKAKKMDYFFSTIGAKNISLGILTKMVENGYDNIIKILESERHELAQIEGLGKKSIDRIFDNIDEIMSNVTLDKIMAGSHVFGTGIGERKIKQILKSIPNILEIKNKNELKKMVLEIDGFSNITADKFVDNLDKFKIFYNLLKEIYDLEHLEKYNINKKLKVKDELLKDEKIVFTGFRDNKLQEKIEDLGGKISTSLSSKTTLVIYADNEKSSSKLEKADKLNIKKMSKSEFLNKYKI